ncbi:MAG: putative rane protein, partial [Ramlibacter sp.]|nr:putative rane protein [Ramlibacter sp.]
MAAPARSGAVPPRLSGLQSEPIHLTLDASAARRLLLARAIDEVDVQGKLLGPAERDQLEREAAQASRQAGAEPAIEAFLHERTRRLLAAVENRHPRLAALQEPQAWRRWILWVLPLAACLLGAALDRIDNPQRVNMLSPPLLGVLFWNLAAYVLLLVAFLWPRPAPHTVALTLQRWLAGVPAHGRRTGRLRPDVLARFHQLWLQASATQQALWGKTLLHLTAAGWAAGLALAIVIGGLVRQYRVGWESTLLDLGQVHAFLGLLFAPVVALLPFDGFSAADLQRMAFGAGAVVGVDEARRWVWMYLALLGLVVVAPRLLLAGWAAWRGRRLGHAVRIDLRDPYFAQVLARVRPARITIGVLAHDGAQRELLQRLWWQLADQPPPAEGPWALLASDKGDTLRVLDIAPDAVLRAAVPAEPETTGGWLQGLLRRRPGAPASQQFPDAAQRGLAATDLVLWLPARPADIDACPPVLRALGKPLLVLAPEVLPCQDRLPGSGLDARVLRLGDVASHWLQDGLLMRAVVDRLPSRQQAGGERLLTAWTEHNERRFARSMQLLARLLAQAARESQEVTGAPAGLRQLVNPAQREATQRARNAAAAAVLERLRQREAGMLQELVRMHRLQLPPQLATASHQDPFVLQRPVDTRQAGVAGAGSGAAMGAGIDLV